MAFNFTNPLQSYQELLKGGLGKIQQMGINTQDIDSQVEQDLQQVKTTTYSKNEFFNDVNTVMSDNNIDYDTAFDETLKYYNSKGYSIEGVDINKELGVTQAPEITPPGPLDVFKPSPLQAGAFTEGFEVAGNIFGALADVLTPEEQEGLGDEFRRIGIESKEALQQAFIDNPEDFRVKTGEVLGKYGLALAPTPFGKTTAAKAVGNIITSIPKVGNIVKSGITGATQVGQFEAITEGEITPTGLTVGATLGPVIDKVGKFFKTPTGEELLKKASERFSKLALQLSPSKTTKAMADAEIKKGTEGAVYIRNLFPDENLEGGIGPVLDLSKKTRDQLGKELTTARGLGNVNTAPVVKWIDDVIDVLKDPTGATAKTMGLDKQLTKEVSKLEALANRKLTINALGKMRRDILDRGIQSVKQVDDYIISLNRNLENFFAGKSEKLTSQVEAAVASKLRQRLDDSIANLKGAEFRKIKELYGKVRTFENNLNKVYVQAIRRKDAILGDFADTFIMGNMGASIASGDIAGFTKAFLQKGIKETIKKKNDPNYVVQQMFELIDRGLGIKTHGIKPAIRRGTSGLVDKGIGKGTTIGVAETIKEISE